MLVLKHPSHRLASPSPRLLFTKDNGNTICYKSISDQSQSVPPQFTQNTYVHCFHIADLLEVRHGWTSDPVAPHLSGTKTLRRKCPPRDSLRSFSLIFANRTVDFTASSCDQLVILLSGLNGLALKHQMERSETMDSGTSSTRRGKKARG
jgi:hypothetical protein